MAWNILKWWICWFFCLKVLFWRILFLLKPWVNWFFSGWRFVWKNFFWDILADGTNEKWPKSYLVFFFLVSSFFRIHGGYVTLNNFLDISDLNFFNIKIFFDNANNELTMIVLDRNSHILRELFYPKAFLSSWNYHNF